MKPNSFFILGIVGFIWLTLTPSQVYAEGSASQHTGTSVFLAAGSALGIGAARLGYDHWEAGLLNQQMAGLSRQFFSSDDVYAAFGFGISIAVKMGVGVYAGLGWEPSLFSNFYFRTEMNASSSTTGQTIGQILMGISYRF